jgi:putative two-component system response regulator
MAVADVYDALRSRRPYKKEFSHEEAVPMLVDQRGKQFDPLLIDAFVALQGEFCRIATQLADDTPDCAAQA